MKLNIVTLIVSMVAGMMIGHFFQLYQHGQITDLFSFRSATGTIDLAALDKELDAIISDTKTIIDQDVRELKQRHKKEVVLSEPFVMARPSNLQASVEFKLQYHRWQLSICLALKENIQKMSGQTMTDVPEVKPTGPTGLRVR